MKHIYIILISLALIACEESENQSKTTTKELPSNGIVVTKAQFNTEKMQLGMLTEQWFNTKVKATGFIDVPPQNKSSVSTFMGGYIVKTPLLIGDKVKKGQLLISLENTDFVEIQQQYLEVAEQLHYLKSEYKRQEILYNEKITSQKNFLKAESAYKSTLALYSGLRKKLVMMNINPHALEKGKISSKINLYAPIDGYITKVNVSNGSYVSPADEILEIVNTEHIHLELSVFEKDILKIKKNQQILFKIPEATDSVFKAEVHLVGTSVNEKDRTIKVHGHIEDDEHTNFIMGMFVEADIITHSDTKMALPKEAVIEIENTYFALVEKNKSEREYTFDKVQLAIGKQSDNFVEVLNFEKLKGKQVLVKGAFMLVLE